MAHLRLIKGRSYTGEVKATREKPDVFTDDEATANALVASGYFSRVDKPKAKTEGKIPDEMTEVKPEAEPEKPTEETATTSKAAAGGSKKTTAKSKK